MPSSKARHLRKRLKAWSFLPHWSRSIGRGDRDAIMLQLSSPEAGWNAQLLLQLQVSPLNSYSPHANWNWRPMLIYRLWMELSSACLPPPWRILSPVHLLICWRWRVRDFPSTWIPVLPESTRKDTVWEVNILLQFIIISPGLVHHCRLPIETAWSERSYKYDTTVVTM